MISLSNLDMTTYFFLYYGAVLSTAGVVFSMLFVFTQSKSL